MIENRTTKVRFFIFEKNEYANKKFIRPIGEARNAFSLVTTDSNKRE